MTNGRCKGPGWDAAAGLPLRSLDPGDTASISRGVSRSQKRDSCLGFLDVNIKGRSSQTLPATPPDPRPPGLHLDIKGR